MSISVLCLVIVLMENGGSALENHSSRVEKEVLWEDLRRDEKCLLLREVLEVTSEHVPDYSLFKSKCVEELAVKKGRRIVNAFVVNKQDGKISNFFPEISADICGWNDVSFVQENSVDKRKGAWQLNVALYAMSTEKSDFSFWMQLVPIGKAIRGTGSNAGCPPEYGFAIRLANGWTVRADKSARKNVPRKRPGSSVHKEPLRP